MVRSLRDRRLQSFGDPAKIGEALIWCKECIRCVADGDLGVKCLFIRDASLASKQLKSGVDGYYMECKGCHADFKTCFLVRGLSIGYFGLVWLKLTFLASQGYLGRM